MEQQGTLEVTLVKTQADIEGVLKAAGGLTASLRKARSAARTGDLRMLKSALDASERALTSLKLQYGNTKDGYTFPEEEYLRSGAYARELIAAGEQAGVSIFERDDRLYCYPVLMKVASGERSVFIDKKRETRLRPSVLAGILKEKQKKPPRFRPEAFLESLYKAQSMIQAALPEGKRGSPVTLLEVYEKLTMLPGLSQDYTKQEFARDIYLLHRSGVDRTKSGARVSFPASSGTRSRGRTITVIAEGGEEKTYFAISFIELAGEQIQ
ncbi:MAG: hypothetical protein HYX87_07895 [Chloroflexi bacterium]|nr:hypothetical protein [Chloroflexota bacterium]